MTTPDHPHRWLQQDVLSAAPALLGWELVSRTEEGETAGRIVEVEAYHGVIDPASHAYRGLTPRTAPMFESGGAIYVYLSYGVHMCLNIVTGPAGEAQAVLIRALEPTRGQALMIKRRHTTNPLLLTSGPGRLTQALGITRELSGTRLGDALSLLPPAAPLQPATITAGPRIGISQAKDQPWRFYLADNQYISRPTPKS